jgi:hypothetical protein
MTKGFLNVLFCLLFCTTLVAQVEVVHPLQDETARFDNINAKPLAKIVERKIPDSLQQKLQKDEAFWYANAQLAKKKTTEAPKKFSVAWLQQQWIRILFWVLFIGGFAAVLIWYLSSLNIQLFRKRTADISTWEEEKITEDIFSIAYEREIAAAVQAQNFRQAVRLHYLQTLSLLSKKGAINFMQDRTNSEYLLQLYNTPFHNDFNRLTRSFEYTCYGKFNLTPTAFEKVQKDFETFYRRIHS